MHIPLLHPNILRWKIRIPFVRTFYNFSLWNDLKQIIKSRQTQLICNNRPQYLLTISLVQAASTESIWLRLSKSRRVKDILVEGQDMSKDSNVREQLVLTSTL